MLAARISSRPVMAIAMLISLIFVAQNSRAQSLSAPMAQYPSAYVTDTAPEYRWSSVPGATSYEFNLMDDTDSVVYFRQDRIAGTSFIIYGAVYDKSKVYHWRVRAFDANGPGPWSPVQSFLIYDPAAVPSISAPLGYITTTAPLFSWNTVAGAVRYDLWIQSADELTTIDFVGGISGTSYQRAATAPFIPYVVYHFKVRSVMADGTRSIWSNPGSFMVYSSRDTPSTLSPKVDAAITEPLFTWTPMESAVAYEFSLMTEDESTVVFTRDSIPVNGVQLPAEVPVKTGIVYHWKVRSIFASGGRSLWSAPASFVFYDPRLVPYPVAPFGFTTEARPLIEWSQVSDAIGYEVEVRDSATQSVLVPAAWVPGSTVYDVSAQVTLEPMKTYGWRVRSVMADGTRSRWTLPMGFQINSSSWDGQITNLSHTIVMSPVQSADFSWSPLAIAGLTGVRYHFILRLDTDSAASTVWRGFSSVDTPGQLALPADVPLTVGANYSWLVQAVSADGSIIGISARNRFVAELPPPPTTPDPQQQIEDQEQQEIDDANSDAENEDQIRVKRNLEQIRKHMAALQAKLAQLEQRLASLKKGKASAARIAEIQAAMEAEKKKANVRLAEILKKQAEQRAKFEAKQAKRIERIKKKYSKLLEKLEAKLSAKPSKAK